MFCHRSNIPSHIHLKTMLIKCQNDSFRLNPLSANITEWSNTLKQFVGKLPTNCLSVSDHFVGLALNKEAEVNNR